VLWCLLLLLCWQLFWRTNIYIYIYTSCMQLTSLYPQGGMRHKGRLETPPLPCEWRGQGVWVCVFVCVCAGGLPIIKMLRVRCMSNMQADKERAATPGALVRGGGGGELSITDKPSDPISHHNVLKWSQAKRRGIGFTLISIISTSCYWCNPFSYKVNPWRSLTNQEGWNGLICTNKNKLIILKAFFCPLGGCRTSFNHNTDLLSPYLVNEGTYLLITQTQNVRVWHGVRTQAQNQRQRQALYKKTLEGCIYYRDR